jgi:hypothetical protein
MTNRFIFCPHGQSIAQVDSLGQPFSDICARSMRSYLTDELHPVRFGSDTSGAPSSRTARGARKRPSHPDKQRGLWARCGVRLLGPVCRADPLTRTLCVVRGAPRWRGATAPPACEERGLYLATLSGQTAAVVHRQNRRAHRCLTRDARRPDEGRSLLRQRLGALRGAPVRRTSTKSIPVKTVSYAPIQDPDTVKLGSGNRRGPIQRKGQRTPRHVLLFITESRFT